MMNSPKDKNSKDKRCNCDLTKNCVSIFQGRTMKIDFHQKILMSLSTSTCTHLARILPKIVISLPFFVWHQKYGNRC